MYINIDNSEINQNTGYCIKIIESEIINISECEINNNIIEQNDNQSFLSIIKNYNSIISRCEFCNNFCKQIEIQLNVP